MIYQLVFSLLFSIFVSLLLYRREKNKKILFTLRTLSLFFLFLFLTDFVFKIEEKRKIKPLLLVEKNFEKEYQKNKDLKIFRKEKLESESDFINLLKKIREEDIFYLGYFDYERKREILNLLMKNKIRFNYFFPEYFKKEDFKITPIYLIRKNKKEGFLIEGDNIEIEVYENKIKRESIKILKEKYYFPEFKPNSTRKITFKTQNLTKNFYVTDIDENFKIKLTSDNFYPVMGFLNRFFKNYLNADIEMEIKGKTYNKMNTDYDFYIDIFTERERDLPKIFIPYPDTFLEGEFDFGFEEKVNIEKIEFKKNLKGDTLFYFFLDNKKLPLILAKEKNLIISTPDLWKINLASERNLEKKFIEIIRKNFFSNLDPKIVPLFSEKESEGEFSLSFFIKSFGDNPPLLSFYINGKKYSLKKETENIYESSLINFKKGKYLIKIFNKTFNLEIEEEKERPKFFDIQFLESARLSTGGEKIPLNYDYKTKEKEKISKKEIFSSKSIFLLLLFITFYSIEIYLRKKRGLL
ncbi:MAG: hypothetical protein ABIM54_05090 [candidate division WOR-3 bacterium]